MTNDHDNGKEPENPKGGFDEHIDEANLILYLDHELDPQDSGRIRSHLEGCALCREVEDELARASAVYSSLQRDFNESLPVPPQNWASFEQRLAAVLAGHPAPRQPWWNAVGNAWRKRRPRAPILPWSLATAAAGLLVAYLWFHSPVHPKLSINEILHQVELQRAASPSTVRPVVYRKLRISVSTGPSRPVTVELWKLKTDGRVKELEASRPATLPGMQTAGQPASRTAKGMTRNTAPGSDLLDQVNQLYAANQMDWTEPISPTEFEKWTDSGDPKDEQVVHENLPDGGEAYRLIARAKSPLSLPSRDVLSEMQLLIRASDWHAIAERLIVQAPAGVRTYEVAELEYRDLPLSEVPSSLFDTTTPGAKLAGTVPHSALGIQPLSGAALIADVLERLDGLDALVKDQVKVTRVGVEGLKLEGTLRSDQRKTEILTALGPLASNPTLELDLISPSEARDRASSTASRPSPIQSIQVPLEGQVPNAYLRDWLAHRRGISGSQLDAEAERFQMEAVGLSADAQLQAQALKNILGVLPAEPVDGEAAEKWRSLVNRHAEDFQHQVKALEQQLAPVFRRDQRAPDISKSHNPEDSTGGEADRLLNLVTASDHLLWQAFSPTSTDSDQRQLTDPKFWLMLEEEDSLAAHLMQVAHP